ncbi:MAG: hypothetical protein KFBDDELM_00187 [Candidatus Argoarchaeum ethanivorans]|uniref:Uncharacterized protein n=1 Tax=Candidatus Argoarchaeum ethanivorans TaxID=2608793 RepID=A0A811T7J0_9EURY|nr:MAG: hypothetical protein KFBDDELM_00187 [Candidatus Argoarchaeum ethanivorans]
MIEKLFERTELPFPDDKTCIDYGQLIKIREGGTRLLIKRNELSMAIRILQI